ncbi:unnamed protein product [Arabidopsis halleri]
MCGFRVVVAFETFTSFRKVKLFHKERGPITPYKGTGRLKS